MSIEERSVFCTVIEKFREQYPKRKINIVGGGNGNEFLTVDDEIKFNMTGYNLLYNLQRLCNELKDELL
jgi:hypothetical protein